MRMPFGKFKGLELADLPDEYLDWLMGLVDLRDPLRMGVEQEAQRREQRLSAEARVLADMIVTVGYQRLTKHYNDEEGRQMLCEAREILRTWLDAQTAGTDSRRAVVREKL